MDSLLLVVARARPDVFESLCRQCTGLEGVRVVLDRRERDGVLRPAGDRRSRAVAADLAALGFAVVPAGGPARPRAGGAAPATIAILRTLEIRSEERRVGKESRGRWAREREEHKYPNETTTVARYQ